MIYISRYSMVQLKVSCYLYRRGSSETAVSTLDRVCTFNVLAMIKLYTHEKFCAVVVFDGIIISQ